MATDSSAETGALVFVDAAAVEAAQARGEASRSTIPEATEEEDKEMAAFQSMLKEYLSRKSVNPLRKVVIDR
jgi:hypothetical protein